MSETCSPLGSTTLRRWPRLSRKATPERGSISESKVVDLLLRRERAFPVLVHRAAAVLARLGGLAVAREHRVLRSGQGFVALEDGAAQLLVFLLLAQPFELVVQIEDQGRGLEPPGRAAGARVQADDEEGLAAEAEREVWVFGVLADAGVVILAVPGVLVGQRLHPLPERALEGLLVEVGLFLEKHHHALEQRVVEPVVVGEFEQGLVERQVVPGRADVAGDDEGHLLAGQRRLGAHAANTTGLKEWYKAFDDGSVGRLSVHFRPLGKVAGTERADRGRVAR